ncbi:MAG: sulfatase-like hydrolase/transferase [Candidatus Tritonobacter lacicola]|nr:sulfatase-like hydrolase/transferase [Candidatus Tritonobacter lacicola]
MRAVYFCAMVGGLVGYGEAASIRELYFTPAGRLGIILVAVFMYALYGAVACLVIYPLWRRLRRASPWRAAVSSSVMAWCLLYGLGYLVISRLMHREAHRFLMWGAAVLVASVAISFLAGGAFGRVLKGKRSLYAGAVIFAALTVWMVFPVGRPSAPPGELPNIILVTIDTIRSDRLHCYGNDRVRTPVLDRLASEGVLFENAVSQIPITNPSHLSILSSTYPHQHGVVENWHRHSDDIPKIVHELGRLGYRTAAFVSSFTLDSRFGFSDGFEIYDDDFSRLKGYQSLTLVRVIDSILGITGGRLERIAGRTNDDAVSWLRRIARQPYFLWVHYYDPHGPYAPPPPYSGMYYEGRKDDPANRSMDGVEMPLYWPPTIRDFTDIAYPIAQYDAEVTYTDAQIGRLLEEIDSRSGDTILVVVGDHGESLDERGYYFRHGDYLYDDQVKVPMIIRHGKSGEPVRVGAVVQTIDIVPTLLDLAGLEAPGWCSGRSLVPLMKGENAGPGEGLSETRRQGDESILDVACYDGGYKLIVRPGKETRLFDLRKDPGELRDISGEREDLVLKLKERIASVMTAPTARGVPLMDRETQERLKSLGYIQ